MQCNQVEEHLSAYLDGELENSEREELRNHLITCQSCSLALDELILLESALSVPQNFSFPSKLAQKLKCSLSSEFEKANGGRGVSASASIRKEEQLLSDKVHLFGFGKQRLISGLTAAVSIIAIVLSSIAIAESAGIISLSNNPKIRKVQETRLQIVNSPAYQASEDFSGFSPEDKARLEKSQREAHEHEQRFAKDMAKGYNIKQLGKAVKILGEGKRAIIAMYEGVDTTLPLDDSQGFYITYLNPAYAEEFFAQEDLEKALIAYKEGKKLVIDGGENVLGRTVLSITDKDGTIEYTKRTGHQ